jgi:hypothetical protein
MSRLQYTILAIGALAIVIGIAVLLLVDKKPAPEITIPIEEVSAPIVSVPTTTTAVIGTSVQGRPIESYSFGTGSTHVLFVGGMHGGYEWNSVLLAYKFIDYLNQNENAVPKELTVDIIPSINPDGLYAVVKKEGRFTLADIPDSTTVGLGRFNANDVDLNRNFACKWQPTSTWRSQTVSAGTAAFSEPEASALRDFVAKTNPKSVVFWHSQANAVYASECNEGVLPGTLTLMNEYAKAAGYRSVTSFDAYPITGDAEGWLASIGIPAITVELSTHSTIEWDKNLAGITAVLDSYRVK